MSVIVLGMEMPKNCKDCFAYRNNAEYDYAYCTISAANVNEDSKARRNLCPLRPLPEKHGRLIDQDEILRAVIRGDYPNQWIDKNELLRLFRNAPTIVEAEGEDG